MNIIKDNDSLKCTGCEACYNICPKDAIVMSENSEGFRYPIVDKNKCVNCGLCQKICPCNSEKLFYKSQQIAYGGTIKDISIRKKSTSGGAFSAICELYCDTNYAIFGAKTVGLQVEHDVIYSIDNLDIFRQSKYVQSKIGKSYVKAKELLELGYKVIFSGTPCQISGLRNYLQKDYEKLLTIEVICEGVPTPLYINKFAESYKNNNRVVAVDYRYKDVDKWDYQVMKLTMENGKEKKIDRWFNPFWNIWLKHLMSRLSCYKCDYACKQRTADFTLGDLWGVHLYCPDLYFDNTGSSLIIANTDKAIKIAKNLNKNMYIRKLDLDIAIKYQSPLRKHIDYNELRKQFMLDINKLEYREIVKKYYSKPTLKLLIKKYIKGTNRQVVNKWLKTKEKKND